MSVSSRDHGQPDCLGLRRHGFLCWTLDCKCQAHASATANGKREFGDRPEVNRFPRQSELSSSPAAEKHRDSVLIIATPPLGNATAAFTLAHPQKGGIASPF